MILPSLGHKVSPMVDPALHVSMYKKGVFALILIASACCPPSQAQSLKCPGDTTVVQRECAGILLAKTDSQLKKTINSNLFRQWEATRSQMCNRAFGNREGSIWPQIQIECNRNLNQALINELEFKLGD